jgi:ABC-type sugar transport system ATPase subunit
VGSARAIAGEPEVLLLDEPTRGVDVGARYDIHALLREITARGQAVVLASSDLPELVSMADRVVVFRDGRVVADVPTEGLDQAGLAALCFAAPTPSAP